jgi:prevent-host-death family protein
MRRSTWSISVAKNRFSAVAEAARRQPQTVTKRGKPAVVVVAADEYARLKRLERLKKPSLTGHLLAMPADGGAFERIVARAR